MHFERILAHVLTGGIFLIPFVPLIIASTDVFPYLISNLFFPYITGKNIAFRAIVEVLTAGWLVLVILDKRYLPKKSSIVYAVTAFLVVMSFATAFGVDPYRSFWSSFERMEGLVTYIHLYLFFINRYFWKLLRFSFQLLSNLLYVICVNMGITECVYKFSWLDI